MNLGYTGKPYDTATGMYNYGYRDYKPEVARFTTVDPIRDGRNWFAYVNNDPVNWVDPWGLECTGSDREAQKQTDSAGKKVPDDYNATLKVQGLKTEPVPYEVPLSANAKQTAQNEGWTDITKNQQTRNEAAEDLREKVLDNSTKDYWAVSVNPILTEYSDSRSRTIAEGALLNGENGSLLPDITESGVYNGTQYNVFTKDPSSGKVAGPTVRYFDMDGNGRIDFIK
jgi:RHS repeat-associated protein